jgi:peptide/nickel transport system substrate-binding protein
MNPYLTASSQNDAIIFTGVYDRLVSLSPDGKTAAPYLASSWTVSPTQLVFTIKPGVTCSDGSPLGPTQIAQSLQYLATQPQAKLLLGAGPYTISSDSTTVTIKLGTAFSDALLNLSIPNASIICPGEIPLINAKTNTSVIGSGPYTIGDAVHGNHLKLTARSDWTWGPNGESAKAPGFPSALNLQIVADESTAANELLTGQLDVASMSGPDVPRLIANKKLTYQKFGGAYLSNIVFNPTVPLVADEKVREAVSLAIDTKAFMQADTGGFGVTSPSFFAPAAACFDTTLTAPAPSVSAAQTLLESDGYTLSGGKLMKGGKQLSLRLLATSAYFNPAATEYVAATLGKVGISISLQNVDSTTYTNLLVKGTYDIAEQFLSGGGPAPGAYILYMTGPSFAKGGGNTSVDDPAVDALVSTAFASAGSSQCPAWNAVQEKVIANHDTVPLDQQTRNYFTNNIKMLPTTLINLDTLHH